MEDNNSRVKKIYIQIKRKKRSRVEFEEVDEEKVLEKRDIEEDKRAIINMIKASRLSETARRIHYGQLYDDEADEDEADEDRAAAEEELKLRQVPGRPNCYYAPATRPIIGVLYRRPGYVSPNLDVNYNKKDEDKDKQAKDLGIDVNNNKINDNVKNKDKHKGQRRSKNISRAATARTKGLNVCMSCAGALTQLRKEIANKTPAATDITNDKVNDDVKNKNEFVAANGDLSDEIRNDENEEDGNDKGIF